MQVKNNTILITGGGSGIGFETARLLSEQGNHVVITGRDAAKLDRAAAQLKNVTAIPADITNAADVQNLVKRLQAEFPGLNMLINNAGRAFVYNLATGGADAFSKAQEEMMTNYLAVIRLTEALLPQLYKQTEAAVVNVSSIVALVPGAGLATYAASKAALHSYTQSLRISLEKTSKTKVFELMPPLVNTDFSTEIGGINGIPPAQVAGDLIHALENNIFEIHVGQTADMYKLHLSSPAEALLAMNA
jgi:uncharacterized oxidoreductase